MTEPRQRLCPTLAELQTLVAADKSFFEAEMQRLAAKRVEAQQELQAQEFLFPLPELLPEGAMSRWSIRVGPGMETLRFATLVGDIPACLGVRPRTSVTVGEGDCRITFDAEASTPLFARLAPEPVVVSGPVETAIEWLTCFTHAAVRARLIIEADEPRGIFCARCNHGYSFLRSPDHRAGTKWIKASDVLQCALSCFCDRTAAESARLRALRTKNLIGVGSVAAGIIDVLGSPDRPGRPAAPFSSIPAAPGQGYVP